MTHGSTVEERATLHAALGDPIRLAIVDHLAASDRSPQELQRLLAVPSNLLSHHLDVLKSVDVIARSRSSGDGRRRYVHLLADAFRDLGPHHRLTLRPVLFVCTANSARSQLAAALWTSMTGMRALSAGTHPVDRVHPGAVAAARRAGLDLARARPVHLATVKRPPELTISVCDRAHEELAASSEWLHWSIPDPVAVGTADAFDATVTELRRRISKVAGAA